MNSIYTNKIFKKPDKKSFISIFIKSIIGLMLLITILFCFTACGDDNVIGTGIIVEKMYGNPVYEKRGSFAFIIAGEQDYFIKVENEESEWQWFRVVDLGVYRSINVGDNFTYDPVNYIPVKNFLDAG